MSLPRLEIDLGKVRLNAKKLVEIADAKGCSVTGVTKLFLGSPAAAGAMLAGGVGAIGDSRIENILRMREAGIETVFQLLRSPPLSRVAEVVETVDVSFNSELETLEALSTAARKCGKVHSVVLWVDLGDLREGVLPEDLEQTVAQANTLSGIKLMGIGTNLACLGAIAPDQEKMDALSALATSIEHRFGLTMALVSGGNSANLNWLAASGKLGRINHLRLGESIALGRETLTRAPLDGLATDAIVLVAEVIESKRKPSVPSGTRCQDAFGGVPTFKDRGPVHHAVLGLGRQDVLVSGMTPLREDLEVFGASSDHVVILAAQTPLAVGEEVRFALDYGAALAAMTSPFVEKVYGELDKGEGRRSEHN